MNSLALTERANRLRIAVLSRNFSSTGGGAERYSISLVEQLAQRHEIHVFAQGFDHPVPNVTFHKISQPLKRPRWVNQIWFATATWWATRTGFDVVHSHENTWHGQVQTVHVLPIKYNLFHALSGWHKALRWLKVISSPRLLVYLWMEHLRYRVQKNRRIVLTSTSLKNVMLNTYGHAVQVMRVITPGVNQVTTIVSASEKQAARQALGLPAHGRCILFVGNDFRKKGFPFLMEALKSLPEEVYVAVVGNAAQIPIYRDSVRSKALDHRIFFLGNLKDMNLAYRAADCLAHPTLEDTFAMVVLEALAFGLPVVVSPVAFCGISDLLTHESNALILEDPRDINELAFSLRRLFTETNLADLLRTNGKIFAQSHLWSDKARQQEQIYFEIINIP
jgi:UDP-glucose:(heptosyl)LPS alpha-1,3-glucosyltransferase